MNEQNGHKTLNLHDVSASSVISGSLIVSSKNFIEEFSLIFFANNTKKINEIMNNE